MFSRNLRFLLMFLCLLLGYLNLRSDRLLLAAIAFAAAAFLLVGYFRYGAVWLATRQLKRGKLPRAKRLLAETPNPLWLGRPQRSQFYFVNGLIASRESRPDDAEENFLRALEIGMRSPKDTAVVHLHLASNCLEMGDRDGARNHMDKATQLPLNPALAPWVASLKSKINAHDTAMTKSSPSPS